MEHSSIIERCKDGDLSSFDTLMSEYEDPLFRLCFGLLGHVQEAQDTTQEVFLTVFQKLSSFDGRSSLYRWMSVIAVNRCRNVLRRRKLLQFFSLEWLVEEKGQEFSDTFSLEFVENRIDNKERLETLMLALNQLSDRHRELIVLREFNGFDYKEISDVLAIPIGTVRSGLSRAKEQLKICLSKEEVS